jgi:hypothetical protein
LGALAKEDRLPELPTTKHRDYILMEYPVRADPRGRLHAASLLRHILRKEKLVDEIWPLCEALRTLLGADQTVWGAKWGPAGFAVELYFYNNARNDPANPMSCARIGAALTPWLAIDGKVDEALPYFMASMEVSRAVLAAKRAAPWRLYLGSGDRDRVQCGFSYRAEDDGLVMENHYWFYQAADPKQLADALRRIEESPRAGRTAVPALAPEALRDCYTICFAVKPRLDGLYFSRISSAQLAPFLRTHGHAPLAETLTQHGDDFAHLSWDLGFDFVNGRVSKLAVHGVL